MHASDTLGCCTYSTGGSGQEGMFPRMGHPFSNIQDLDMVP